MGKKKKKQAAQRRAMAAGNAGSGDESSGSEGAAVANWEDLCSGDGDSNGGAQAGDSDAPAAADTVAAGPSAAPGVADSAAVEPERATGEPVKAPVAETGAAIAMEPIGANEAGAAIAADRSPSAVAADAAIVPAAVDATDAAVAAVVDPAQANEVEEAAAPCPHLESVRAKTLRTKLPFVKPRECEDCAMLAWAQAPPTKKAKKKGGKGGDGEAEGAAIPYRSSELGSMWLCLACANVGCGRAAPRQHALAHVGANAKHCIVMNMDTLGFWCYKCDRALEPEIDGVNLEFRSLVAVQGYATKFLNIRPAGEEQPATTKETAKSSTTTKGKGKGKGKSSGGRMPLVLEPSSGRAKEAGAAAGRRGISNIGNTCFFNSTLQSLTQSLGLRAWAFAQSNPAAGRVTVALRSLLRAMWSVRDEPAPSILLGAVTAIAPQFRGRYQQDAHELLRCLLDGLRSEEQRVRKAADEPGPLTSIDELFSGVLCSTVCCLVCGTASRRLETFFDLSLSIQTRAERAAEAAPPSLSYDSLLGPTRKKAKKIKGRASKVQAVQRAASGKAKAKAAEAAKAAEESASEDASTPTGPPLSQEQEDVRAPVTRPLSPLRGATPTATAAADAAAKALGRADGGRAGAAEGFSVADCLAEFTQIEELDAANRYACGVCTRAKRTEIAQRIHAAGLTIPPSLGKRELLQPAVKRLTIASLPAVLTLHLKRFGGGAFGLAKIGKAVDFGVELDLAPWVMPVNEAEVCGVSNDKARAAKAAAAAVAAAAAAAAAAEEAGSSTGGEGEGEGGSGSGGEIEAASGDADGAASAGPSTAAEQQPAAEQQSEPQPAASGPRVGPELALLRRPQPASTVYHLFGVVVHSGSMSGGHYVAYTKRRPLDGGAPEWLFSSDRSVSRVSEAEVLTKQAYMLFYERADTMAGYVAQAGAAPPPDVDNGDGDSD